MKTLGHRDREKESYIRGRRAFALGTLVDKAAPASREGGTRGGDSRRKNGKGPYFQGEEGG